MKNVSIILTIIPAEDSLLPTDIVAHRASEKHLSSNKSLCGVENHVLSQLYLGADLVGDQDLQTVAVPPLCGAGISTRVLIYKIHLISL